MHPTDITEPIAARAAGYSLGWNARLLFLAFGNLALSFAGMSFQLCVPSIAPTALFNGVWLGQAAMLGMVAGFVFQRRLVGLAWVVIYAVMNGAIFELARIVWSPLSGGVYGTAFVMGHSALATYVVLFGWRILIGSWTPVNLRLGSGQFGLADALEWMFSLAIWLGLIRYLGGGQVILANFPVFLVWWFLQIAIAVPWSLTLISSSRRSWKLTMLLGAWTLLGTICAPIAADGWPRQWDEILGQGCLIAGLLGIVLVNSLFLRQLGYRWYRVPAMIEHRDL